MICAVCKDPVAHNGKLGYVHEDGSRFGADGHEVVPIKAPPTAAPGAQAFGLA